MFCAQSLRFLVYESKGWVRVWWTSTGRVVHGAGFGGWEPLDGGPCGRPAGMGRLAQTRNILPMTPSPALVVSAQHAVMSSSNGTDTSVWEIPTSMCFRIWSKAIIMLMEDVHERFTDGCQSSVGRYQLRLLASYCINPGR